MANHKSALKRARQSIKKHTRNTTIKSNMKSVLSTALEAIKKATTKEAASAAFGDAQRVLNKAASLGVIPKKRASRKISRIAKGDRHLSPPTVRQ